MKRVQLISLFASLGLLGIVLELVRRKLLKERFALLWIFSALVLVLFSFWADLLEILANLVGIYYAPAVLLPIMLFFVIVLFLYFSVIVTKQGDRIKTMAQNISILEERVRELEEKGEKEE
ncbi:DUF2304 domain-containing protein [bacterium]|nr:DUF2304 domain-containing protein [bacterium]